MRITYTAWLLLILAIGAWTGVFFLYTELHTLRHVFADERAQSKDAELRGESAARLHSTIATTEVERGTLESLAGISILDAVGVIENAGKQAGAATFSTSDATTVATSQQGLSTIVITVQGTGSFVSLARAITLIEAAPVPSTLDQFEITKGESSWRLTARVRVIIGGKI